MSLIFSELIEDYFLSNIKNDIFGDADDNTTEDEQVEKSEYYRALSNLSYLTTLFQILKQSL